MKAQIGSISHGTLRPEDLCAVFFDTLCGLNEEEYNKILINTTEALMDALNAAAPAYCYFGTHEDAGSDFGFWPLSEAIDALQVQSEAEPGEDYKVVSDHGNVTVFNGQGAVILEVV